MSHPLPPHTCGTVDQGVPERLDPQCPACNEGVARILDSLRVTHEEVSEDADCFTCGLRIASTARHDGIEIEVTSKPPNIGVAWAGALRCEHGTVFYHRPTRAWVDRQNARHS